MSAASRAKRRKPEMDVIVLEKTEYISYGSCGLPYYISDMIKDHNKLIIIPPKVAREKRGIDVRLFHEAVEINPQAKRVKAVNHETHEEVTFDYDKLVVATGAGAARPPIPGIDLKHVYVLRTLNDGVALKSYINTGVPKKAVIIGAGYIGLEMAEAFHTRGLDVTIIEKLPSILGTMDAEINDVVEAELERNKAKLFKNQTVRAFEGNGAGEVKAVVLEDGSRFEADLVLVATGIKPHVKFAEAAGIRLGPTGAIAVNEKQETSVEDIYAGGDCAEARHLVTGKPAYIPLGPTANKQGRVAGENAAGGHGVFGGIVGTAVFKTFNLEVARTGLSSAEAEREGFNFVTATITDRCCAGYYPGASPITIKLVMNKDDGRLLGAMMVGQQGVSKRIDIFATALYNRNTVEQISRLDLSYAPPFAPVWDPVLIAANIGLKALKK
ncbi:MAG: FAD-dependent oxidoreductase [Calditrichaeota bacterium]|nr:FAD-dependent oxidoreductase [Calditrichota bacterium]